MIDTIEGRRCLEKDCVRIHAENGIITRIEPIEDSAELPWLLPKFVDNHCHILPTGLDMLKIQLGGMVSRTAILDVLADKVKETEPGEWVLAVHYDQNRFADSQHLTRAELDQISTNHPILLRHVNGHASIANSLALERAGVNESTPDPSGGEFVRDTAGRLNGILLEHAHEMVTTKVPNPDVDAMTDAILAAAQSFEHYRICAASDMMTGRYDLLDEIEAYSRAANKCNIRFRLYVQWSTLFGARKVDSNQVAEACDKLNQDKCRVAGVKIFADGAIGSRTAAIYGQYEGSTGTTDEGQLIYAPERLHQMIKTADEAGYQIAIHSIGDRSTDLVLDGFAQCENPKKHRLEHAMILSDAQLDRIAELGCYVTMQPEFLQAFAHAYHKQLGAERAHKLKRYRSILERQIPLSLSSDRPIVSGDPNLTVRLAAHRPEGFDPSENLNFEQAMQGATEWAALAQGDKNLGKLEPGYSLDIQKLEKCPF